jgi:tetratricopeptide (TPR) repeat protein
MSRWLHAAILITIIGITPGCKGMGETRRVDETVGRYAQKGSVAFAEGQVNRAIKEYRRAIHRAWAIDDAYESGTNAYNLAACMISENRPTEAKDWLLDARFELCRAGASLGNVYLLQAKIALSENRIEDVYSNVDRAACSDAPCGEEGCECKSDPGNPCSHGCITKIPCVGPKLEQASVTKECVKTFEAQVELTRARLAAEQYDIPTAVAHFSKACKQLKGICGYDPQAELQNVAALIHLAKGEHLQAAGHLDCEAENLRCAGIYRELPITLTLAAAAYEQAGRLDLAANRLCRAARIRFGHGEIDRSWQDVQAAIALAETACSETTKIRLALLVNEISQTLENEESSPPSTMGSFSNSEASLPASPMQTTQQDGPKEDTPREDTPAADPQIGIEENLPAPNGQPLTKPPPNLTGPVISQGNPVISQGNPIISK